MDITDLFLVGKFPVRIQFINSVCVASHDRILSKRLGLWAISCPVRYKIPPGKIIVKVFVQFIANKKGIPESIPLGSGII
jgi:hypothetical protein